MNEKSSLINVGINERINLLLNERFIANLNINKCRSELKKGDK